MTSVGEIFGYLASICIPLAFLPQTIEIIKTKKTKGISIISYSIYLTGGIFFLVFGILADKVPMIICQTITGLFAIIILSIAVYNKIKEKKGKIK